MKTIIIITIVVMFYYLIKDGIDATISKLNRKKLFIDCIIDAVLIIFLIMSYIANYTNYSILI